MSPRCFGGPCKTWCTPPRWRWQGTDGAKPPGFNNIVWGWHGAGSTWSYARSPCRVCDEELAVTPCKSGYASDSLRASVYPFTKWLPVQWWTLPVCYTFQTEFTTHVQNTRAGFLPAGAPQSADWERFFPAPQWFNHICRNPLPHLLLPFLSIDFSIWRQAGVFQRGRAILCACSVRVHSLHGGQERERPAPFLIHRFPSIQAGKKRASWYTDSEEILPLHPVIETVSLSGNKTGWKSAFEYFFPLQKSLDKIGISLGNCFL